MTGNVNKYVDNLLTSGAKKFEAKATGKSFNFKINSSTRADNVKIDSTGDVIREEDSKITNVCDGVYELSLILRIQQIKVIPFNLPSSLKCLNSTPLCNSCRLKLASN